jgi:large-conductance mechanosensitive channel
MDVVPLPCCIQICVGFVLKVYCIFVLIQGDEVVEKEVEEEEKEVEVVEKEVEEEEKEVEVEGEVASDGE